MSNNVTKMWPLPWTCHINEFIDGREPQVYLHDARGNGFLRIDECSELEIEAFKHMIRCVNKIGDIEECSCKRCSSHFCCHQSMAREVS